MFKTDKRNGIRTCVNTVSRSAVHFLFAVLISVSLCSCSSDGSAMTAPPSAAVTETANTIEGHWYGYWENEMDVVTELLIRIAGTGQDRYSIVVYESAEPFASVAVKINCTFVEKNTLIFDSGEMINSGKGVIADGLFKGEFTGEENGTFVLHQAYKKENIKLAGKWEGRRESDWDSPESIAVNVTKTGNDKYRIEVMEPFAQGGKPRFSLEGSIDDSGRINFSGQSEEWTGTGWGFCGKDIWSGTFEGGEYGRYTLHRVKS